MHSTAGAQRLGITLDLIVLDCPDTRTLATFYSELLGWSDVRFDDDGWAEVRGPRGPGLAFQPAPDHVAPTWPDPGVPQQSHLDLDVDDLEAAHEHALALGAIATGHPRAGTPGGDTDGYRVFRDPAGHLFCLCRRGPSSV